MMSEGAYSSSGECFAATETDEILQGSFDLFGSLPHLITRKPRVLGTPVAYLTALRMTPLIRVPGKRSFTLSAGRCPRCPIMDMPCFEGDVQPKGHSLESC